MDNKNKRRAPRPGAPSSNSPRGSELASPERPRGTTAPPAPTPAGRTPHGRPNTARPFKQAPSGQLPSGPGGGAHAKMAAALGENDADLAGRRPKRCRVAEAGPAHKETELPRTRGLGAGEADAPPPGRQDDELACEPGGMAGEMPEMANAGAATVVNQRAADGAAGTNNGLAATVPLFCVGAQPAAASTHRRGLGAALQNRCPAGPSGRDGGGLMYSSNTRCFSCGKLVKFFFLSLYCLAFVWCY